MDEADADGDTGVRRVAIGGTSQGGLYEVVRDPAAVDALESRGLDVVPLSEETQASLREVLAEEANQQWTARFNPRPVTEADIVKLYQAAW